MTQADPESGYDPAYPWKNRDPRFYKTIMFDGVKWQSTGGAGGSSELLPTDVKVKRKMRRKAVSQVI